MFQSTFLNVLEALDLERFYQELKRRIQEPEPSTAAYRIIDKEEPHPKVRIGELKDGWGSMEFILLEGIHPRSNCQEWDLELKTMVVWDNCRLTSFILTFNIEAQYLSVEEWIMSGNHQALLWKGNSLNAASEEYSYLLWLFATMGDYEFE